jgi:hypothetical protein
LASPPILTEPRGLDDIYFLVLPQKVQTARVVPPAGIARGTFDVDIAPDVLAAVVVVGAGRVL